MPKAPIELNYTINSCEVISSARLARGEDIPAFAGELVKPSMRWENWDRGFSAMDIPGLAYGGCQLVVGQFKYAARGNRSNPQSSRSQSVVSEWTVDDGQAITIGEGPHVDRITAFFPVYDGIGFWIAKKRREEGICDYTLSEQIAISQAATIGALGMGETFSDPIGQGHLVYRCIWAPGKAFDENGELLLTPTNTAFSELGLIAGETTKPKSDQSELLHFRLFGDARTRNTEGNAIPTQFNTYLAERLHPAWEYVNGLPSPGGYPPADKY
jgi:hypothetical protein